MSTIKEKSQFKRRFRPKPVQRNRENCPQCGKKKLEVRYTWRTNYPFGRKSKPRLFPKKKVVECSDCGHRATFRSPPLMNVDKEFSYIE